MGLMDIQAALDLADELVLGKTGEHLSDLQREILRASWSWEHQSYDQIAETYGYSANYLKKHVGPELWKLLSHVLQEKVSKTNARSAFERRLKQHFTPTIDSPERQREAVGVLPSHSSKGINTLHPDFSRPPLVSPQIDWGEAIALDAFYGRQQESHLLEQWIMRDRCRLVGIFGVGGIGKTSLSASLTQKIANAQLVSAYPQHAACRTPQFEYIIWRSLRNAPLLHSLLTDLIQVLSNRAEICIPATVEEQITQLISYLRNHRCLLVLDNGETILQGGNCSGRYRLGYENYADLFKSIGETLHQSCLVLTSREKPNEIAWLEGETLPVRSLSLQGLQIAEGQQLFQLKLAYPSDESTALVQQSLVQQYSGNPLVLKIVATTIQEVFDGVLLPF